MATTAELMRQGRTTCARCNGGMRVADGLVGCDVCGFTDDAHPLTAATREARAAPPRVEATPPAVRLEENAGGHGDRLIALERRNKALEALAADLGARLRAVEERETQGGSPKPRRAG